MRIVNGGINILVVEDDVKLNQIVCTYLNDSGFHAKGCLNAKDAYDEMYNNLYELIISDIMMPEIDGFEFAQTVGQVNKTIPILFMSAKDDLPSKQKGFQLGIDDYMVKPIELDELLLRVRALLRRVNIEMERKITVGNLELDADAMSAEIGVIGTAFMAGATLVVTPQEPNYILCIILAVPGFLGWIFPYFLYKKIVGKQTERVTFSQYNLVQRLYLFYLLFAK